MQPGFFGQQIVNNVGPQQPQQPQQPPQQQHQQPGSQPPPIGFFAASDQPPQYQPQGGFNQPGFNNNNNQPGFQQNFSNNQPGFNQPGYFNNQPNFPPQNQPGYRPNQPGGFQPGGFQQPNMNNYQPSAPSAYQPGPQQQYYNNNNPQPNRSWNPNEYLRQIFMQIDVDRNNFITPNELQQALAKAQPNFSFDPRTIEFILRRFDANHDMKISFDEFYNLYAYLNDEYATFVINDMNGNGTIEANELTNTLCTRLGTQLNQQIIQMIVSRVEQMLQSRISFDIFCRVNARFDILCRQYQQQRPQMGIEQFFMQQFFNEFW